ncbi:pre-mRNA 3'-end-processing factor FIP1-like [Chanos chanos]|uniref:Pre-mRNA 3'-end-processing factor FIP1-like n=1 Tax=Chanos chanos TaxID=29144 RepID=A0A6J2WXI3_CHACN|nr:pre-mRNA 3'-end-processing factor FIP1-like [Chanos chanos]
MATNLTTSEPVVPTSAPEPVDDEEHWLYGDDDSQKNAEDELSRDTESVQLEKVTSSDQKDAAKEASKGAEDEEEEDSDSDDDDDDDVKVTIGNIKTGPPSYMGTGMNLSLKPPRGFGTPGAIKSQTKGIDLESLGGYNGPPVVEVEMDLFEDKPWRKPGADLSDYFNYGFNEETWKAYCEKQRRLQLGLEPSLPPSFDNKITVQQGRTATVEKEAETLSSKLDYKTDFLSPQIIATSSRLKAGPPPNRKLGGTIDVIGGQTGAIRRVEGRRREMQEQNPIQVLGDHSNKTQPLAPPTGPPPLPMSVPPPHFLHPPPPVSGMPPPMHPPGIPPPAIPGLFPPPLAPPPNLMMPPVDSRSPTTGYGSRPPPPFGYSGGDSSYISYPPVSSAPIPWGTVMDKGGVGGGGGGHWDYQSSRRESDRERERERNQERGDRTPTSEYNEEERYHYYGHERDAERDYERSFHHARDSSRGREEHSRDRRHRDKEECSKHKSSKRKQHDDDGDGHRKHKHKKSKRSKEDKGGLEVLGGHGDEHEHKD